MKDKLKGLITGICVGSLLTGTTAFAAGSQIEVTFKNIRYLFNGAEKTPVQDEHFIYKGQAYLPIRFVGEALGKKVVWDEANQAIHIDSPAEGPDIAVTYQGGSISRSEHATYLKVSQFYNPAFSSHLNDPEAVEYFLKEHVAQKLAAERGRTISSVSFKEAAAKQLAQVKNTYTESFSYNGTDWNKRLSELNLTEAEIMGFIEDKLYGQAYFNSLATDSALREAYTKKAEAYMFDFATFSAIRIGFRNEDGSERSQEEALQTANAVVEKLKAGGDFARLASEYSDDPVSRDNGGRYVNDALSNWDVEIRKMLVEQPLKQLGEPLFTGSGYYIFRVDSRSAKTFDEVKEDLRNSYIQAAALNFRNKEAPGLIITLNLKK